MAKQIIVPQAGAATSVAGGGAEYCSGQALKIALARQHGVKVDTSCPWHDEYTGSMEALVAAGLATMEHFPGRPGGPKKAATFFAGVRLPKGAHRPKDQNYVRIVLLTSGKFSVTVGLPREVSERRFHEACEADKARRIAERHERASAEATIEEFRRFTSDMILMAWRSAAENTATSLQPFALEATDIERLRVVLREALAIVKTAHVVPLRERAAALSKARHDTQFQSFMTEQGFRDLTTSEEQQ